jgi:hypothetical protein
MVLNATFLSDTFRCFAWSIFAMKNNNNKKHSFQCRRTRVPPVPPLDSCAMVILMACFMKVRRPAKINKISKPELL